MLLILKAAYPYTNEDNITKSRFIQDKENVETPTTFLSDSLETLYIQIFKER
jgi:hypothetical protein